MLQIKIHDNYEDNSGLNSILLKFSSGLTIKDKFSFSILKWSYVGLRLGTRIILGRKKRNKLFSEKNFDFIGFISRIIGSDSVIKCDVSKYGYRSYCRSFNSFHDLIIMTTHEADMLQLFHPNDGDIVVDIGSFIGKYTLTSSNRVGLKGKVVAIEGDPSYFEMLNKNLKLNKTSNVTAINCIVFSKEANITIEELLGRDLDKIEKTQIGNTRINVNTLDNLLIKQCGINEVNWIKIDVEGAELEVLKGAHKILTNSKRIKLQIEIHGVSHLYKPIVEFLHSNNFKIKFEKDEEAYRSGDKIGAKQIIAEKTSE